jgi:hypothetical protein
MAARRFSMSKQPITAPFNALAPKTFAAYMAVGANKYQIIAALQKAFDTSDANLLEQSKTRFTGHYEQMANPARDLFKQAFDEFVVTKLPYMQHKLAAAPALARVKLVAEYGSGALKADNATELQAIMDRKLNDVVTAHPAFAHGGYHSPVSYGPKWS